MKKTFVITLTLLVVSLISLQNTIAQITLEHGSGVISVAFLRDGTTLASGSSTTVRLWDVETHTNIATLDILEGHWRGATSVAFSPDGTLFASAGDDEIQLWDVATQQNIATLEGHQWGATSVAFSSDGTLLASAGDDEEIKLWDTATYTNTATLEDDWRVDITLVAFSPDGTLLASGDDDGRVKLWDVSSHKNIATLEGHQDEVTSVAFSLDGTTLASGGKSFPAGEVKLWDLVTYQNTATLTVDWDDIYSVAFSPDSTLLSSGGKQFFGDGAVKLWDVTTHENIATLETDRSATVTSVVFSPDGTLLASGSREGKVKLWNIAEWTSTLGIVSGNNQEGIIDTALANPLVVEVKDRGNNPLSDVQVTFKVSEGGGLLNGESTTVEVTTDANGRAAQTLTLGSKPGTNSVDVSMGNELVTFTAEGVSPYQLVKISGDDQQATFGTVLANPLVVEVRDWQNNLLPDVQVTFRVTQGEARLNGGSRVERVTTDSNGRAAQTLVLGYFIGNTVEVSIGTELVTFNVFGVSSPFTRLLRGHSGSVNSVSFSPDGMLASGSSDGTVKLWDTNTQTNVVLEGHSGSVISVAFSPDRQFLASGSADNTVILWNVATHTSIAILEEHTSDIISLAFSDDGTLLATGAWDGIVKVWDTVTKENIATLEGHEWLGGWLGGWFAPVSFSPDSTLFAFGAGHSIKVWDVETRKIISTFEAHADHSGVVSLMFSPDGSMIASGSMNNIKLWDAETFENIPTSIPDRNENLFRVTFSPDSSLLAYQLYDSVVLWNLKMDTPLTILDGHTDAVTSLAFSHDGSMIASGSSDGTVNLWDVAESKIPRPSKVVKISGDSQQGVFGVPLPKPLIVEVRDQYDNPFPGAQVIFYVNEGHGKLNGQSTIARVTTDANGRAEITLTLGHDIINSVDAYLAGRGFFGYSWVNFTTVISPFYVESFEAHLGGIDVVSFSPDGQLIASGSRDNTVKLWDAKTHEIVATLNHRSFVTSVMFSPDGTLLGSIANDEVKLWNVATHENTATVSPGSVDGVIAAFSQDLKHFAWTVRWIGREQVNLWDVEAQEGISIKVAEWPDQVISIAFSPDGTTLAIGVDEAVVLLDVETREIASFKVSEWPDDVTDIAFSPDGRHLVVFSDDAVRLWDVETHEKIATMDWATVTSFTFSSDGSLLAVGSSGGSVRIWDISSAEFVGWLIGHNGSIRSVVFSSDGATIASAASDNSVKIWDVASRENIATFIVHDVLSIAFSPDGTTLVSGALNGTLKFWDISSLITPTTASESLAADVNGDGVVDIQDLVLVASNYGQTGENVADINGDGVVHIYDIILVAAEISTSAAAPSPLSQSLSTLTAVDVQQWLSQARQLNLTDATSLRGIRFLEQLLIALTPKETALLPNYPNPFNPETWMPYQLAKPADIRISIYSADGKLVRTLTLGHQAAGVYQTRSQAAYWDGKNAMGEAVASGLYFYTLTAGDFSATRKMLILK